MAIDTSSDMKSTVIYQVFTRNFSESGTFDAVIPEIQAIKDLGTDIIWFTPIHPIGVAGRKGAEGSPYAIRDYRAVDDTSGGIESFKRCVDAIHKAGLKVMIDVVYNHTSVDSVLTQEHPEWFLHRPDGSIGRKVEDWSDVSDLDFSHPELREYLISTLETWAKMGVDGFRCDVASLVPLDFWEEARRRLNKIKPVIWLAESIERSFISYMRKQGFPVTSDPEIHSAFDLTYDYDGFEYLKLYARGEIGLEVYLNHISIQQTMYPSHAVKMRFLENHDNPRAADVISSRTQLMNWTGFYQLLPGAILVYMGQEWRAHGWPNLFEKDPIRRNEADREFFDFFGKMILHAKAIKQECTSFSLTQLARGLVMISWESSGSGYTAILNLEDRFGELPVSFTLNGTDLLSGQPVDIHGKMAISKKPILVKALPRKVL